MPRNRKSKTELSLSAQLDIAGNLAVRTRIYYELWRFFEEQMADPERLHTMNLYADYFRFTMQALKETAIVNLYLLFESRDDTINLHKLLRTDEVRPLLATSCLSSNPHSGKLMLHARRSPAFAARSSRIAPPERAMKMLSAMRV